MERIYVAPKRIRELANALAGPSNSHVSNIKKRVFISWQVISSCFYSIIPVFLTGTFGVRELVKALAESFSCESQRIDTCIRTIGASVLQLFLQRRPNVSDGR